MTMARLTARGSHLNTLIKGGEHYALIEYSMDAIVAAEVMGMILAKGKIPLPRHIFLASHECCAMPYLHDKSNGTLNKRVI